MRLCPKTWHDNLSWHFQWRKTLMEFKKTAIHSVSMFMRLLIGWLSSFVLLGVFASAHAQNAVDSTQRVIEEIISVRTPSGSDQQAVLSRLVTAAAPTKLLVVVSGHPGVTRPRMNEAGKITTRQNGNFLVRSRHFLISNQVVTLLLDCRSDFESSCPDVYQASLERAQDIALLVEEVKNKIPSLEQTWAVSTSRGVITTAGLLKHDPSSYTGIIHTAGTYSKATDLGLAFGPFKTPQFIYHHKFDPCPMTYHRDAAAIAEKWGVSLVTVDGGAGFRGDACQAFTQHGFTGREEKVAVSINRLVETGVLGQINID